ncbi:cation:proton antiporter [uncultured Piscinibacter sp.]|uniref:cation:proton antiporter n=1 Tax=uncultured Piscinibacter sp. TaxID=1131835 RepID=UPI002621C8E5|nr:cation:proton antiporter [uncultured Piscinibacter sp.]
MLTEFAAYLQVEPWPPVPDAMFWSALALVAGALLGEGVQRGLGLPRIVGYSVVGMAIALSGHGLADGRLGGSLRLIVDLALALLLFELGSRLRLRWLRINPALLWTSGAETLLSFAAIVAALAWLGMETPLALACATITVAASGAVVGRVATELKAEGQVTERMLMLTALNTLFAVLVHKLVIGWLYLDRAGNWGQAIAQPLYTFGGSVLLAFLLAGLVAWVARRLDLRNENSVLLLLGMIVLALTLARAFSLSTLLVPLLAGVVLRNSTERPWVWPRHFGTAGGVLVLMLFVVVGSAWSVQALALGAAGALLLLAARGLAKAVAVIGLARWSGIETRQGVALTLTLMPVSGTALVLFADLHFNHPDLAITIAPVVLTAVAAMELAGPLAVQWGLRLADEDHPAHRPPGARA